eukprot:Skav212788  [mRNA]  locus=scaffold159:415969:421050:- [translate_table: standard]
MELIFYELRQTARDVLSLNTDWRRIPRRAAPFAAAATLGAGALWARKRQVPPESNFLGACDFSKQLQEKLKSDFAALQRAARRFRGPIERDLMQAHSKDGAMSTMNQLIEQWKEAGFLSEPLKFKRPREANPGIDLITQVDESYGRDIGSEVPLCMIEANNPPRTVSSEDWATAADALEKHGAVILQNMISLEQLGQLRERLYLQSSMVDLIRWKGSPHAAPLREFSAEPLQAEDEDLEPHISTQGRQHFYLRGRIFEEAVAHAQAGAMPLVWEHLCRQQAASPAMGSMKPYVSEVQLMLSDPCAEDQFWHVDNAASGLTLMVPLTALSEDMGAALLLPGSHRLFGPEGFGRRVRGFLASLLSTERPPAVTLAAGDALLYDARRALVVVKIKTKSCQNRHQTMWLLHRLAANRRYDRMGAVLVFRYDFERPPGMGLVAAQIWSWTGNLLSGFHRFYGMLPGPTKPGV